MRKTVNYETLSKYCFEYWHFHYKNVLTYHVEESLGFWMHFQVGKRPHLRFGNREKISGSGVQIHRLDKQPRKNFKWMIFFVMYKQVHIIQELYQINKKIGLHTLIESASSDANSSTPRTTKLRWLLSVVRDQEGGRPWAAFLAATIRSTRLSVQWGKAGQCSRIGHVINPRCWNRSSFLSASKRSNALYLLMNEKYITKWPNNGSLGQHNLDQIIIART